MPALVSDLPTPALLVDRARLAANLDRMQARATAAGVRLRPHAKTHKTAEIARMQHARGARGLTVATVDEAEAFAGAGFDDLRLATPVVGAQKLERLAALAGRGVRVSLSVDSPAGARLASAAFAGGPGADVLLEIDTGHGRCGVFPADAPALAGALRSQPGLRLAGVLTHGGHAYRMPGALGAAMAQERDGALEAAARLVADGYLDAAAAEVSVGSTPTCSVFEPAARDGLRVTEWRPGNYVFGDAQQVALGSLTLADVSLLALATVVSKRRFADGTEQAVVDAGSKTLTDARGAGVEGYGTVLYSPRTRVAEPHARVVRLSEEHGVVAASGGLIFDVGDPVFVVPNHACVAVATRRTLVAVDGDEVAETWDVLAR